MDYFNPNDYWRHQDYDPYKGMNDEERLKAGCWQLVVFIVAVAIGMIACSMFTSCKSVEYVTVPEVHNEHHWHTDSVHQTDSIIRETQTTIMQLDSAAMARYGIQLKSAERAWLVKTQEMERQIQMLMQLTQQKDSVHDTVPVPVPVIKEVPADLSLWQQTRLHIANILLWALLIVGIVWIIKKKLLP